MHPRALPIHSAHARPSFRPRHAANDRAVDAAYGYRGERFDALRRAFVFALYQRLNSLLLAPKASRSRAASR